MSQPYWPIKFGQDDQLTNGMLAEVMDAASRSGTEALDFPALSFCAMVSLGPGYLLQQPSLALLGMMQGHLESGRWFRGCWEGVNQGFPFVSFFKI